MKTYLQESFSDIANPAQLNAKICSTVMRQGGNIDDYCYQKIHLISAQRNHLPENLHDVADVQELISGISYLSLTRAMAKHMNEFGSLAEATTYARKKYRSLKFQEDMVAENEEQVDGKKTQDTIMQVQATTAPDNATPAPDSQPLLQEIVDLLMAIETTDSPLQNFHSDVPTPKYSEKSIQNIA